MWENKPLEYRLARGHIWGWGDPEQAGRRPSSPPSHCLQHTWPGTTAHLQVLHTIPWMDEREPGPFGQERAPPPVRSEGVNGSKIPVRDGGTSRPGPPESPPLPLLRETNPAPPAVWGRFKLRDTGAGLGTPGDSLMLDRRANLAHSHTYNISPLLP